MDRHWDQNTKVQFPLEAINLLLKLIYPSLPSNTKSQQHANLVYYGKTLWVRTRIRQGQEKNASNKDSSDVCFLRLIEVFGK